MKKGFYQKTADIYEKAGLNVEKSDIKYFIEKTKPNSMASVASMTYLMFDELNLKSASDSFGIDKLLILSEAFNIKDEQLRILTKESKDSVFDRKLGKENYAELMEELKEKVANNAFLIYSLLSKKLLNYYLNQ